MTNSNSKLETILVNPSIFKFNKFKLRSSNNKKNNDFGIEINCHYLIKLSNLIMLANPPAKVFFSLLPRPKIETLL